MIAAILVILGYIFFEVYSVSHIEVKTETAVISTVYEKVDAKAIIIRDEQTIGKSSGAITVPCLNDGDKINVGGNTAMTFSSQDAATNYSKYAEIQNELAYYENLESQTQGQAASVESIDSEIKNNVNLDVRTVDEGIDDLIVFHQIDIVTGIRKSEPFHRYTVVSVDYHTVSLEP